MGGKSDDNICSKSKKGVYVLQMELLIGYPRCSSSKNCPGTRDIRR